MQPDALLAALARLYPASRLLTAPGGLAPFESDGLTAFRARPRAVVLPETPEDVIETVRLCHEARVPFVARWLPRSWTKSWIIGRAHAKTPIPWKPACGKRSASF